VPAQRCATKCTGCNDPRSRADIVIAGTPIDLGALLPLDRAVVRVSYEFEEAGEPTLQGIVAEFLLRTFGR